jgi:hypothetical protein
MIRRLFVYSCGFLESWGLSPSSLKKKERDHDEIAAGSKRIEITGEVAYIASMTLLTLHPKRVTSSLTSCISQRREISHKLY